MKIVRVVGPGRKRSKHTMPMAIDAATKLGVEVSVEKVSDYAEIAGFGALSMPALVVDGEAVHAAGLSKPHDVARWIGA